MIVFSPISFRLTKDQTRKVLKMPKITFNIPSEIRTMISKHSEINWDKVINDTLWNYAKKIKLLDSITSARWLTDKDVDTIDHAIKADLLKQYQHTG